MTFEHGDFELIKMKLARSIKDILTKDAAVPDNEKYIPCEVHIPYHQLVADDDEPMTAAASVTYVVHGSPEKKHTVRIKFNYDNTGKFIKSSMTYV